MNHKILCLLGVILLLCLNIVSASNVYVNSTGNDFNNGLNTSNPKQTIKNAVSTANNQDIIYISKGVYKENNITINKTLTLMGDKNYGTIIDAQNKNRIFNITKNGRVTIKYIIFKNGNAYTGGAIFSYGALYVSNCKFVNNKAKSGSAIYAFTNSLTVKNSVFHKNKGGAAVHNINQLTKIYNSTFKKNTRGINANRVLIKNSIFTGNVNKNKGSAITATKAVISGSKFSKNRAKYYGGAIYTSVLRIKNSRFTKNSANYGGAISIYNIETRTKNMIYKCVFTRNSAKYTGGAIYLKTIRYKMSSAKFLKLTTVKKSKFKSNKAKSKPKIARAKI